MGELKKLANPLPPSLTQISDVSCVDYISEPSKYLSRLCVLC